MNWNGLCIAPLCKGKYAKYEGSNSRGIRLLVVVGKLYCRVMINKVRDRTECVMGEVQCGFRKSRGCMDHVFAIVRCVNSMQLREM